MSRQPLSRLLIVCGILAQGIMVSSVENTASSGLFIRQKRSNRNDDSEPLIREDPIIHQRRVPMEQLETPSAVSIRVNGIRVGLGTVVHPHMVATKASYVGNTPLALASVTFYSPSLQDYERREVRHIEICRGIPGEPLEPHNVALIVVNRDILVDMRNVEGDGMLARNFSPGEISWIRQSVTALIPRLRRRNPQ